MTTFAIPSLRLLGLAASAMLVHTAHAASATAIFAGGCFWCTESDFEKVTGVIAAESGYTAGKTPNPTYEAVSAGQTGHTEAVRVTYDPARVSYAQLVEYFWKTIDPSEKDRQFCDVGSQYRSGIYWGSEADARSRWPAAMRCRKPGDSRSFTPNLRPPAPSTWPRTTTKTITRRTRCATTTTA